MPLAKKPDRKNKIDNTRIEIRSDLICYETQVEATATDGTWVIIPYDEIADVGVG
jgi:hypothetical protein